MELKQCRQTSVKSECDSSNRTFMELKHRGASDTSLQKYRSNRTFMELKPLLK